MTISIDDLLVLRQAAEHKKDHAQNEISEFTKEIAAIDVLIARMREREKSEQKALDLDAHHPPPLAPQLPFAKSVRQVVGRFGNEEFSGSTVERVLKTQGSKLPERNVRTRIAMELKQMLKKNQIVRTHKGTGTDPHRYRYIAESEKSEGRDARTPRPSIALRPVGGQLKLAACPVTTERR
jgi:hypothetical protein